MDSVLKIVAVLVFVVVAWLSLAPAQVNYSPGTPDAPLVSLFARMAILFITSTLMFLAWRQTVIYPMIFMAVAAIILEVGQIFSTNRLFSIEDLLGNLIGVAMAFLFFRALWQFAHRLRA